jgi:hypothetical protein
MPAIQLPRLKIQAAKLAEQFADPVVFCRGLHNLLDFYASRAYHPGQAGDPPPLMAAYHVPPPVLREVIKDLTPFALSAPESAFALSDALWSELYLEFRLLAVSLLGLLSPHPPDPVILRVRTWAEPRTEARLIRALINTGLTQIRREYPVRYLQLAEAWLTSPEQFSQKLGLQALVPLLDLQEFQDIPLIIKMLTPLVRTAPFPLRPDLIDVIAGLAKRSPQETAYFLRQNLAVKSENPVTAWLIRQSLHSFPVEIQTSLRTALHESK